MRLGILFAFCLLFGLGLRPGTAEADTLMQQAELWGELHAAAIYCRRQDSSDFGRAAMAYFKRRAGSSAEFNRLRDTYGVKAVELALKPPTRAAGGNCYGFSEKYQKVWTLLRGG